MDDPKTIDTACEYHEDTLITEIAWDTLKKAAH